MSLFLATKSYMMQQIGLRCITNILFHLSNKTYSLCNGTLEADHNKCIYFKSECCCYSFNNPLHSTLMDTIHYTKSHHIYRTWSYLDEVAADESRKSWTILENQPNLLVILIWKNISCICIQVQIDSIDACCHFLEMFF